MRKLFLLLFMLVIFISISAATSAAVPDANHVYRGIYFGMTVKQFHENLLADEKMELSVGIPEIEIEGAVYNIFALYDDDRLFEIYFESPNYIANYYINKRIEELSKLIEADYGAADEINEFEISEVEDDIMWYKKWEREEKIIEIGVGKFDTENYVSLHMIYLPIYEELYE